MQSMYRAVPGARQLVSHVFAPKNLIWWTIAIAFVIRLAALLSKGVLYDGEFFDAIGLMESARSLLATGTFSFYDVSPSARHMPGFVFFLAGAIALAPTSFTELLFAKVAILLVSTVSVYMLYLLGRRIGGTVVGLIAAAMLAVSMPHIYAGVLTLTENVFLLLLLGLTLSTICLADNPGWKWFVVAAAIFCLALYTRQVAIGFLLPAVVYLWVRGYPRALLVKQGAALVLIVVVTLTPWWFRNYQVFGEFVPFTAFGGAPFFEGAFQDFHPYGNEAFDVMSELLTDFDGSEVESGRLLTDAGRARLSARWQEDPTDLAASYLIRKPAAAWLLPFYWDSVFGISGYWVLRIHAAVSVIGIGALVWLSVRSRARHEFLLLLLNVLVITLGAAYYLGLSRYVFPYTPFLYVGIGYAFECCWRRVRARDINQQLILGE